MLLQLSSQSNDAQAILKYLHDSYKNGEPPISALLECVRKVVQKFQDMYLAVDALDESPRHSVRERVLETLADFRRWLLRGLYIPVTSRDKN